MKSYQKPVIRFFDLHTEERLANPGSKCYETGQCSSPVWSGLHP